MMEATLAPLKSALKKANLLEPDWKDVVGWLEKVGEKNKLKNPDDIVKFVYGDTLTPTCIDSIIEAERRRARIKETARTITLDRAIIEFFKGSAFFTEISRYVRKTKATMHRGRPVPTAAMCYNVEYDDFEMVWNPEFMAAFLVDLGDEEGMRAIQFVYAHELVHFTLKHITVRRRTPHFPWNIATDAANNSLLVQMGMKMLECGIYPGRKNEPPKFWNELRTGNQPRPMTELEQALAKGFKELLESWSPLQSSETYFNDIMKWVNKNGYKAGNSGISIPMPPGEGPPGWSDEMSDMFGPGGMDIHDMWDDIPKDAQERIGEKFREIMKAGARKADNEAKGWGNMPASMQKSIKAYINNTVDWEQLLSQFFGSFNRGDRTKSIKKINRKYPYMFAGHKRTHLPRILIAIDQSGSVSDANIALCFGVIYALSKLIDFTIIFFDTSVDTKNIVKWRKGSPPPKLERTRTGGTDFDAPIRWMNDPRNGEKFDGLCILTDGECCAPTVNSRVKKAWLIVPGHKLHFPTKETVIQMEESGRKRSGVIV